MTCVTIWGGWASKNPCRGNYLLGGANPTRGGQMAPWEGKTLVGGGGEGE